ncbi:hypothetical protein B0H12DRAFT_1101539, partial [Mycena haematopus]
MGQQTIFSYCPYIVSIVLQFPKIVSWNNLYIYTTLLRMVYNLQICFTMVIHEDFKYILNLSVISYHTPRHITL